MSLTAREIGELNATPLDPFYGGDNPGGMTIRQAYKMAALQGMLAGYFAGPLIPGRGSTAKMAGEYADAMLAEDAEHAGKGDGK